MVVFNIFLFISVAIILLAAALVIAAFGNNKKRDKSFLFSSPEANPTQQSMKRASDKELLAAAGCICMPFLIIALFMIFCFYGPAVAFHNVCLYYFSRDFQSIKLPEETKTLLSYKNVRRPKGMGGDFCTYVSAQLLQTDEPAEEIVKYYSKITTNGVHGENLKIEIILYDHDKGFQTLSDDSYIRNVAKQILQESAFTQHIQNEIALTRAKQKRSNYLIVFARDEDGGTAASMDFRCN